MEKFQITKEGYQKLRSEIDNLKNIERPKIISQIATARELGDLRENAEYHSAHVVGLHLDVYICFLVLRNQIL